MHFMLRSLALMPKQWEVLESSLEKHTVTLCSVSFIYFFNFNLILILITTRVLRTYGDKNSNNTEARIQN